MNKIFLMLLGMLLVSSFVSASAEVEGVDFTCASEGITITNLDGEKVAVENCKDTDFVIYEYPVESWFERLIKKIVGFFHPNDLTDNYKESGKEKMYNICKDNCNYPENRTVKEYGIYYDCVYNCAKTFGNIINSENYTNYSNIDYNSFITKFLSSEEDSNAEEFRENGS
jgi:hypothetical protein